LQFRNAPVTAGMFAPWTPVGAIQVSGGYDVGWIDPASNQYIVWRTDTAGNYTNTLVGAVAAADPTLEALETIFGQDIDGDGTVGINPTQIIETAGSTQLWAVGNEYVLAGNTGSRLILQDRAAPVIAGQRNTWVPIGAEQTSTGFEVAWKHGSLDEYIVWNTDATGDLVSSPTNVVTGTSGALEGLESSFSQDLNGDGTVGVPTSGSRASFQVVYISVPTAIIRTSPNTASASSGLSVPSLTFIGSPNAVVLGAEATAVAYDLQPSSGIETVADFVFGKDWLQIGLMDAPSNALVAFDTSVGGVHAIAFANANDLAHGIVLLNMTGTGETAANVLGSRTYIDFGIAHIG
jgi:serralysin